MRTGLKLRREPEFYFSCLDLMYQHTFLHNYTIMQLLQTACSGGDNETKLFEEKYVVRFETFALNELLDRPTPQVMDHYLTSSLIEVRDDGNSRNLDRLLGFVDDYGNKISLQPLSEQKRMNDIMEKILHAKGKDFHAITQAIYKMKLGILSKTISKRSKKKSKKIKQKLNVQQFIESKEIEESNLRKRKSEQPDENPTATKVKTAKDFEHYRKTQRPARL